MWDSERAASVLAGSRIVRATWLALLAASILQLGGCANDDTAVGPVNPAPAGEPWDSLSQWALFVDGAGHTANDGVVSYDVASPLFSDYALKRRFVWLPESTTIAYDDADIWQLPVGAIVAKTFAYPVDARDASLGERAIETRLMIRESDGWASHTYIWNDDQSDAVRKVAGRQVPVTWIDADGVTRDVDYLVPNTNECAECHGEEAEARTLGIRSRQLGDQVEVWSAAGYLDAAPAPASERLALPDPFGDAPLDDRARSYLDVNCSHCHSSWGVAKDKTLHLDWDSTAPGGDPKRLGICKLPTSAGGAHCGNTFDLVPGDADASVLICRMETDDIENQMPPLGRSIPHTEGVALIRAWIDAMDPSETCGGE